MASTSESILIIKGKNQSLKATETFLLKRGFQIFTTVDLKEGVEFIHQHQPDYILLAADHPNKKIKILAKEIKKITNGAVIGFVDNMEPTSILCLQEFTADYPLYPPISGPSVVRLLSRIGKDQSVKQKLKLDHLQRLEEFRYLQKLSEPSSATGLAYNQDKQDVKSFAYNQEDDVILSVQTKVEISKSTYDSLLLQGALKEIKSEVAYQPGSVRSLKITEVSRLMCVAIDSSRFRGYLTFAFAENRFSDDELVVSVQTGIRQYLTKNGVLLNDVDYGPLKIDITHVDFDQWANAQADFVVKSVHEGREMALAFFPMENVQIGLEKTELSDNMLQIPLKEIQDQAKLEFDLYLYLSENRRFLHYQRKGRQVLSQQIERLLEKGIQCLFLRKEDKNQVAKYKAQNYFNERIAEYLK
jgi:DNA-binding response OmpR family regulator